MSDTNALLVQLGLQYVQTGGVEALKRDLTTVTAAAKAASAVSTQAVAKAVAAAQVNAGQLYRTVVNSLGVAGRSALAQSSIWANQFSARFKTSMSMMGTSIVSGLSKFDTAFMNAGRAFITRAAAFGTSMRGAFTSMGTALSAWSNNLANYARNAYQTIAGGFSRFGAGFMSSIRTGISSGVPPASLGDSRAFRNSMNMVASGLNNVSNMAMEAARVGLTAVVTQFTALMYVAKNVAEHFIGVNEQFQELEITLKSALRGPDIARGVRTELAKITAQSPLPYSGIAELARALVVIPQTRGRIADQALTGDLSDPEGFLRKSVLLVEKMLTFRPDKHVRDAVYSIREALGGEFRSLVRRFDIPVSLISQLAGKSVKELKTDSNATMDALMKVFDKIITTGAIRERAMQPSVVWQNIKEQVGTVAALSIGDSGIYKRIQNSLVQVYDIVQELTRNTKDATGADIKGTSLLDKYSKPVSDSLITLFDSLRSKLMQIAENLLARAGFGERDNPNKSFVERSFMAVKEAIEWLSEKVPIMIDKAFNIFSTLIPILTKIGSIVVDIVDNLTKMFSNSPMLTSLGMLFGPTRIGIVGSAAGMSPLTATMLGAAASPGLIRGIGRMMPRYDSGGRGSLAGIASTFATDVPIPGPLPGLTSRQVTARSFLSGAARLATSLAVRSLVVMGGLELSYAAGTALADYIENKRRTKAGEVNNIQDDFRAWLSQNPNIASNLLRPTQNLADLRENPSAFGAKAQNSITNTFEKSIAGFSRANELLEAVGRDPVASRNLANIAEYIFKAHSTGKLLAMQTQDQVVRVEEVSKQLADWMNGEAALTNLDDALGSSAFKGSLREVYPVMARMQSSTEQSGSQHFKERFEAATDAVVLLMDTWKNIDQFIGERDATNLNAQRIEELLSNRSAILDGQKSIEQNFSKTYNMLMALKEAKMPLDARLSAQGIPMALGDAIKHYGGILKELEGSSNTLSAGLLREIESMRMAIQSNRLAMTVNTVQAASASIAEVSDVLAKGELVQGISATQLFENLRRSLQSLGPDIYNAVSTNIKAMENAVPKPDELDKETQMIMATTAKEQLAQASRVLANYMQEVSKRATAVLEQIFNAEDLFKEVQFQSPAARLSRPGYFGTRPARRSGAPFAGPVLGGAPDFWMPDGKGESVNGSGVLPPLPPTGELKNEVDRANETGQGLAAQADMASAAAKKIANDYRPKTEKRSNDDRMLDAAITNAIQDVTGLLNSASRIEREGPLAQSYRSQFRQSMGAFPELSNEVSENIGKIFQAYREGSDSVTTLQEKLRATLTMSEKLADALAVRGKAESGKGNIALGERFTDASRRMRIEMAETAQALYELDQKLSHPFQSFFEGMRESFGNTKNLIMEMGRAGQAVGDTISRSLGGAFSSWVVGAKSGKEAFQDFAQSVISDLARMAAEAAARQLLGLLVNTAFAYFGAKPATGGNVPGYSYSYASGFTKMATGGRISGGSGIYDDVPIMGTAGEYVLSRKAVARMGGVGNLDRINFMAEGGSVGRPDVMVPTTDAKISYEVNIPITVNTSGSGESGQTPEQQKQLARQLETAVKAVIAREQRPGGSLAGA